MAEDEREDKERSAEEELEVGAFPEKILVGTEQEMGMKAKDSDEVEGSDLSLEEEGTAKVFSLRIIDIMKLSNAQITREETK